MSYPKKTYDNIERDDILECSLLGNKIKRLRDSQSIYFVVAILLVNHEIDLVKIVNSVSNDLLHDNKSIHLEVYETFELLLGYVVHFYCWLQKLVSWNSGRETGKGYRPSNTLKIISYCHKKINQFTFGTKLIKSIKWWKFWRIYLLGFDIQFILGENVTSRKFSVNIDDWIKYRDLNEMARLKNYLGPLEAAQFNWDAHGPFAS